MGEGINWLNYLDKTKLYYLSSPYSHPDESVMDRRAEQAEEAAAELMLMGYNVFSPIAYNHKMAKKYNMPRTWDFWEKIDMGYVSHMDGIIIYELDGWEKSVGVKAEMEKARDQGKPIYYITEKGLENAIMNTVDKEVMERVIKERVA